MSCVPKNYPTTRAGAEQKQWCCSMPRWKRCSSVPGCAAARRCSQDLSCFPIYTETRKTERRRDLFWLSAVLFLPEGF